MLISKKNVPANGSDKAVFTSKSLAVHRIIINCAYDTCVLRYNGIDLLKTVLTYPMYELKFDSYYGYPDSSKFEMINYSAEDALAICMFDTVPASDINPDYFEKEIL